MATTLKINRNQLAKFLPDHESIRQFEELFTTVDTLATPATGYVNNSFETVNQNLNAYPKTLVYTGSQLTSIIYNIGSGTITKTFTYSGRKLQNVVLSGTTPSGIDLTKILNYTGNQLVSVAYP